MSCQTWLPDIRRVYPLWWSQYSTRRDTCHVIFQSKHFCIDAYGDNKAISSGSNEFLSRHQLQTVAEWPILYQNWRNKSK